MAKLTYNSNLDPYQRLLAGVVSAIGIGVVVILGLIFYALLQDYIGSEFIGFLLMLYFVMDIYVNLWNKFSPLADNKIL